MYQKRNITVAKAFAITVAKHRTKTCLIFEDTSWSFQDLEDYSNRVGNYFLDLGYKVSSKCWDKPPGQKKSISCLIKILSNS